MQTRRILAVICLILSLCHSASAGCKKCRDKKDKMAMGKMANEDDNGKHEVIQGVDRPKNEKSSSEEKEEKSTTTTTVTPLRLRRESDWLLMDQLAAKDICEDYAHHPDRRDIYRDVEDNAVKTNYRKRRDLRRNRNTYFTTMDDEKKQPQNEKLRYPPSVEQLLEEKIHDQFNRQAGPFPGRRREPTGPFPDPEFRPGGHHHHHPAGQPPVNVLPKGPHDFLANRHFNLEEGVHRRVELEKLRNEAQEEGPSRIRVPREIAAEKSSAVNDEIDTDELIRRKLESELQEKKLLHEQRMKQQGELITSEDNLKLSKDHIYHKLQNDLNRQGRAGEQSQRAREEQAGGNPVELDESVRHKLANDLNRQGRAGDHPHHHNKRSDANQANEQSSQYGTPGLNDAVRQKLEHDREKWKARAEQMRASEGPN